MNCKGLHCPGCKEGGGIAAIIVLVAICAIGTASHHLLHDLELLGWYLAFIMIPVVAGAGLLIVRRTSNALRENARARQRLTYTIEQRPTVIELPVEPLAIEPPTWPHTTPYYQEARNGEAER